MEVVILKTDGTPVRLDNKFTQLKFDSEGFFFGFTHANETYKFFQNGDFEYKGKDVDLGGYYAETVVHQYIANMYNTPMTPLEIKAIKNFPFAGLEAQKDDPITVKVVDFSSPYNYYYKENTYTFNIELADNKVKKYKKPVFDNVQLIGFEIDLPSSSFPPTPNDVNLMGQPTGYFFQKNFGEFVGNWSVTEAGKRTYKKITTLSAYKINYIVEDVIKHIISGSSLQRIYGNGNSGTSAEPDPNGLSPLENLVFTLLWNWGYFYKPTDDPQYIYRTVLNPIMSGQPNFYEYSRYYNGLCQFYFTAYRERDKLKELADYKKIEYLLSILPLTALKVMPYSVIKSTLLTYIIKRKVTEEEEQFIVRLVLSVDKVNADNFLDFLLERANGIETNFDVLYNMLDDARIERYPVASWFFDEETNRKYFAYAVYELWKKSKYDWNYFSDNIVHAPDEINQNSYFFQQQNDFNRNNVLEFSVASAVEGEVPVSTSVSFSTQVNRKKIKIEKVQTTTRYYANDITIAGIDTETKAPFGEFHLYHPITLIGYQPNLDLQFPRKNVIPAFLFHFAQEYGEIADFDAGVSLAINIGIDIALFFATGGVAVLNDLKYLKYVTDIGKALRGVLPATEAVVVWRGASVGGETISYAAGVVANYQTYLASTETDPAKKAHHEKIQYLVLGLMLLTSAGTVYASNRAVREANEIKTLMGQFANGAHGVPTEIETLVNALASKRVISVSELSSKLQDLKTEGVAVDNVISKYSALAEEQQYKFFEDFGKLSRENWIRLNQNASTKIDNWLLLKNADIAEARNVNVISDQRLVNGFLRYYAEPELRLALEKLNSELKRIKLIDEVSNDLNLFNNFKNDASLLEGLIRYRFEPNFIAKFEDLLQPQNQTKLLDFLKRYGNCSDEGFRMIRSNADIHVDRLLKYPEATHNIQYFNNRRAEMLPPDFKEADKGDFFNLHEIDNFIEVEIAYGGKAIASLRNEAGDIKMLGGSLSGQSLDPLGLSIDAIPAWEYRFTKEFNSFTKSIKRHFGKISNPKGRPALDKVVIDYKYMDEISVSIGQSPNYLRLQIDQYILSNFPQYNNSTYLIKINY